MKELSINFKRSIQDLVWLLDRKYPKKSSVELVGNRYRLSHDQRMMLYRGVFDTKSSMERKRKRIEETEGNIGYFIVDGYNIIITLESYLKGRTVFRSLDGYVRDTAGVFGNHTFTPVTERSIELLIEAIGSIWAKQAPCGVVYLDSPVSKSGELAAYLREQFGKNALDISVEVVRSPDFSIVQETQKRPLSVTATSDTALIDRVVRVIDLPERILSRMLNAHIPDLETAI